MSIVLVAVLIAAVLPIVAPLFRENAALAETMVSEPNAVAVSAVAPAAKMSTRTVVPSTAVSSTTTPTFSETFSQTYAQAVSMMLVGSLLIAIGAVVRRGI